MAKTRGNTTRKTAASFCANSTGRIEQDPDIAAYTMSEAMRLRPISPFSRESFRHHGSMRILMCGLVITKTCARGICCGMLA